jgi:hypothetical protein
MGFDGSSIEGFARIDESDMLARPDPTTFQLVPWRPASAAWPACSAISCTRTSPLRRRSAVHPAPKPQTRRRPEPTPLRRSETRVLLLC